MTENAITRSDSKQILAHQAGSRVPGIQYMVVNADRVLFEYVGGWANVQNRREMTPQTTLMAYSMTKTFTAVAILQLVEQGKLGLNDEIDLYLQSPYGGHHISIRQLLDHTSGIPNPIPLRWVHLATEHLSFDEDAALAHVLRDNSKLRNEPGQKFSYSNIGYWLLGKIVVNVMACQWWDIARMASLRRGSVEAIGADALRQNPRQSAKS